MSKDKHSNSLSNRDYEDIQSAVMETDRGRWFLNEYAQRNRVADTQMLLDAIKKLEGMIAEKETAATSTNPDAEKLRFDIVDMANAIALTKQEIAGINPGDGDDSRLDTATAELDAIVVAAETATSDILGAAETVQEIAWSMREDGATEVEFDRLDALATDIYTACSFQDITGQRTSKVINVLQYLETRILAMMNIWGIESADLGQPVKENPAMPDSHLLNGPALEGEGVDQGDVDLMMFDEDELFDAVAQPAYEMASEQVEIAKEPETSDIIEKPTEDTGQDDVSVVEFIESVEINADLELQEGESFECAETAEVVDFETAGFEAAEDENAELIEDDVEFQASNSSQNIDDLCQTDKTALFT